MACGHGLRRVGLDLPQKTRHTALPWNGSKTASSARESFIPRRDTSSQFNRIFGGRVFPGVFQKSIFKAQEAASSVSVRIVRVGGGDQVVIAGHLAEGLPRASIFPSLAEAVGFFSLGATGYSATHTEGHYHGMQLRCLDWSVVPLAVEEARSCFFDDREQFPAGTAQLDCALLMRGIAHEWHSRPDLYLSAQGDSLKTRRSRQIVDGNDVKSAA